MASYKPTKKWYTAAAVGGAAVLTHLISTGEFDGAEQGGIATLLLALASAYIKSNDATVGGVPPNHEV